MRNFLLVRTVAHTLGELMELLLIRMGKYSGVKMENRSDFQKEINYELEGMDKCLYSVQMVLSKDPMGKL